MIVFDGLPLFEDLVLASFTLSVRSGLAGPGENLAELSNSHNSVGFKAF